MHVALRVVYLAVTTIKRYTTVNKNLDTTVVNSCMSKLRRSKIAFPLIFLSSAPPLD